MSAVTSEKQDVVLVDVSKLKPHPMNNKVYGDEELDEDFQRSVQVRGVLVPMRTLPDGTIISGHRRWRAAKKAGIRQVPTTLDNTFESKNDPKLRTLLIELNFQRPKTNAQRIAEFDALNEANEEIKRANSLAHLEGGDGEVKASVTKEKAAKIVGLSRPTADKGSRVLKRIKELKKEGKHEEAKALTEKLNKSVHKAAREMDGKADPWEEISAGIDWVLKQAVPRVQEIANEADRKLNKKQTSASGSVANAMAKVNSTFADFRKVVDHARKKAK